MGCIYTLLGLAVVGFFVGPWVLLALQHRRQRSLDARLTDVGNQVAKLRAIVERGLVVGAEASAAPSIGEAALPAAPIAARTGLDREAASIASGAQPAAAAITALTGTASAAATAPPIPVASSAGAAAGSSATTADAPPLVPSDV